MPTTVSALIITGYGTNCEVECEHAVRLGGADKTRIIHFSQLISGEVRLPEYNFLIFPGGFLDGDDLGAAQAAALRWKHAKTDGGEALLDQLAEFIERGGIALGICNGFQLMVKLGLLPGLRPDGDSAAHTLAMDRSCSLAHNDSARYEDRWCSLKVNPASPSVFTRGLDTLYLPVRHGEGKFTARDEATMQRILANNLVALQYIDPANGEVTQDYPLNPNGSPCGIAGVCDPTGRLFGLMPHPEAFNHITNHPRWTALENPEKITLGVRLFTNGVRYLRGEQ